MKILKTIDTLVEDIQNLFSGKELLNIANFSEALSTKVASRFADHLIEREPYLRLSAIGKPTRQLWYDLKGYKGEALSADTKMKFLFGDILEELLLFLAAESGHTVERIQEKVELDGVPGSIDAVIDGVLVDTKSASTYSWNKFNSGLLKEQDPFGYIQQISAYSEALGGYDGAFLVIDKTLGKLCLDKYTKEELKSFRPRDRIKSVREAIQSDIEPPRCYSDQPVSKTDKSDNRILAVGCSYCNHKQYCWRDSNDGKGLRQYVYSTGVKFFTKVVKEPRVQYKDDNS